jgi:hypothetical protein
MAMMVSSIQVGVASTMAVGVSIPVLALVVPMAVEPKLRAGVAVLMGREEGVAVRASATAMALVEAGQGRLSGGILCMVSLVVLSA